MQAAPAPPQLASKKESIAKLSLCSACPTSTDQPVDFPDRSTTNPLQIGGGFFIGQAKSPNQFVFISCTYRFNLVNRCNSRDLGIIDS
jgi:hypothetical protein